jgi:hypothetical protein
MKIGEESAQVCRVGCAHQAAGFNRHPHESTRLGGHSPPDKAIFLPARNRCRWGFEPGVAITTSNSMSLKPRWRVMRKSFDEIGRMDRRKRHPQRNAAIDQSTRTDGLSERAIGKPEREMNIPTRFLPCGGGFPAENSEIERFSRRSAVRRALAEKLRGIRPVSGESQGRPSRCRSGKCSPRTGRWRDQ